MILEKDKEDYCDSLWRLEADNETSQTYPSQVLPSMKGNLTDYALCPMHPLIAVTSDIGEIAVFKGIENSILCSYLASVPATCIIWPEKKLDGEGASILVGFHDGTLRWLAITKDDSTGKDEEKEEEEILQYDLLLKTVVKPHNDAIICLNFNSYSSLLVSQGLDSKLFIFHLENFDIQPLGFYVNHHQVECFEWFNYPVSQESNKEAEKLLIFCKHSYFLEVDVSNVSVNQETDNFQKSFYMQNKNCQVYKINGLLHFHELGDRISPSDFLAYSELSENERNILVQLKYKEKKEARETREKEQGLAGPLKPPKIICSLRSTYPDRIWLSLGENDSGYLFEFELNTQFSEQPIDLTPIRAIEVSTANTQPIISMCYSENGRYLFMGLQDGSMHMCKLDKEFDISAASDFKVLFSGSLDKEPVKDLKISKDGSMIRRVGEDGNKIIFNFNAHKLKEITDKGIIPAWKNKEMKVVSDVVGQDILSIEDMLKHSLSEKHEQVKDHVASELEELKKRYIAFKEKYTAYLEKCQSQLKRIVEIPENLKLNYEIVSCCPTVVEAFREETKAMQRKLDIKYQKDFVKISLLKQKYFKCFKSRITSEKLSVEDGNKKIQTFRQCVLPVNALNIPPKSYPKVYGQKLYEKCETAEIETGKKNDELIQLKQKLGSAKKDLIDNSNETPVPHRIAQYNKRKLEYIEKLQTQISEIETLENITVDETMYTKASEEIESSFFKFKEVVGFEHVFPDITCTFAEKKQDALLYLKKINAFTENFNSYVIDARNMKDLIEKNAFEEDCFSEIMENQGNSKKNLTENKQISVTEKEKYISLKTPKQIINWDSYPEKQTMFFNEDKTRVHDSKSPSKKWLQQKFKNLFSLLIAVKPAVNCEKTFNDIRFLLKCIELNAFKGTASDEKMCLRVNEELKRILETERSDLSAITEEISSLRSLRQQEKYKWMNLYHNLVKLVGPKHKHKGYFKQVFKKKVVPKSEQRSQRRHTSSESSESEQNIDSAGDSQTVMVSEVDEELLQEVMKLRLKRQEVEDKMKELKRKIRNVTMKENAARRKIQKANSAMKESSSQLDSILVSRKQAWGKLEWPVVLYPKNIHSDYISNQVWNAQQQKQEMESEMKHINEEIQKKLAIVNNCVNASIFTLTSRVVTLEVNDLIDVAAIFFPLLNKVSSSVDEHFENLKRAQSLEHLEMDSEPPEPSNIIGEILANVKDPDAEPESDSGTESQTESSSRGGDPDVAESKSYLPVPEETVEVFSLSDFKTDEIDVSRDRDENRDRYFLSWRDVCDNDKELLFDAGQLPESEDSDEIVNEAIPGIDYANLIVSDYSTSDDYYMLPFTYSVTDNDLEKLKISKLDESNMRSEEAVNVLNEAQTYDPENSINKLPEPYYPVFPGGGLKLTLPVLRGMENTDPDHFPYTEFCQKTEFHEELKAKHVTSHIQPQRSLKMEVLFNYTTLPFSEFLLAGVEDVEKTLKFYFGVKASNEELEVNLRSLQKTVLSTKRALIFKQHDAKKVRDELETIMKSRFGRVLDLDQLQDALENPHFRIKKREYQLHLETLKRKLNKMKESEAVALRSLDQLRFEDTKVCYELFELRKDFKFLNKCYSSKRKVLPKIGEITKYENDD